jgi:hypothetical protein
MDCQGPCLPRCWHCPASVLTASHLCLVLVVALAVVACRSERKDALVRDLLLGLALGVAVLYASHTAYKFE